MNSTLTTVLDEFIDRKNSDGAFFINGAWGVGKTYFIDNNIVEKYKKDGKKIVRVSLNGLDSIEAISNKIFIELFDKKASASNAVVKVLASSSTSLISLIPGASTPAIQGVVNEETVNKIYNKIKSKMKVDIIIFDDFERCILEESIIFGYISDFIDKTNCKIIVVGNEGKMKVAQNNDYLIIKEKVIYRTYDFKLDPKILFSKGILGEFDFISDMVLEYKEEIEDLIIYTNFNNIRTFKFALDNATTLLANISELTLSNEKHLQRYILMACLISAVGLHNNYTYEQEKEYTYVFLYYFQIINSIKKYTSESILNIDKFKVEILDVDKKMTLHLSSKFDSYHKLTGDWYKLSEKEVTKYVEEVLSLYKGKKFDCSYFIEIYYIMHRYQNEFNIDQLVDLNELKSEMIELINQCNDSIKLIVNGNYHLEIIDCFELKAHIENQIASKGINILIKKYIENQVIDLAKSLNLIFRKNYTDFYEVAKGYTLLEFKENFIEIFNKYPSLLEHKSTNLYDSLCEIESIDKIKRKVLYDLKEFIEEKRDK